MSYVLDLATHSVANSASWRVPVGLQLVWGLGLLSGIFFLPESPYVDFTLCLVPKLSSFPCSRHLLGNGKVEEARRVVAELNGVPVDDALVTETVDELQFAINEENAGGKVTWAECFSSTGSMWSVFFTTFRLPAWIRRHFQEANRKRHDVTIHPAIERPEFLL